MKMKKLIASILCCTLLLASIINVHSASLGFPCNYMDGLEGAEFKSQERYTYTEILENNELISYFYTYDVSSMNAPDYNTKINGFRERFKMAGFTETTTIQDGSIIFYNYTITMPGEIIPGESQSEPWSEFYVIYGEELTREKNELSTPPRDCIYIEKYLYSEFYEQTNDIDSTANLTGILQNFEKTQEYSGNFADIPGEQWYAKSVAEAYEYGLISGVSDTQFDPERNISIAESVVLACRIHSIYNKTTLPQAKDGGDWYSPFVEYAIQNGILTENQYENYDIPAPRGTFVRILIKALPKDEFNAINKIPILSIPDVNLYQNIFENVYTFYRAGILSGNDGYGTFNAYSNIKRCEAASIIMRMVDRAHRKQFELTVNITEQEILYSASGNKLFVVPSLVESYKNAGWYDSPPTTASTQTNNNNRIDNSAAYSDNDFYQAPYTFRTVTSVTGAECSSTRLGGNLTTTDINSILKSRADGYVPGGIAYTYEFNASVGFGSNKMFLPNTVAYSEHFVPYIEYLDGLEGLEKIDTDGIDSAGVTEISYTYKITATGQKFIVSWDKLEYSKKNEIMILFT